MKCELIPIIEHDLHFLNKYVIMPSLNISKWDPELNQADRL